MLMHQIGATEEDIQELEEQVRLNDQADDEAQIIHQRKPKKMERDSSERRTESRMDRRQDKNKKEVYSGE